MKDILIFLKHILESIEAIKKYCLNVNKEEFMKNQELQDAVIRRIEIIGEAVKNIPDNFKEKYKEIPWSEISGARDKLIHKYFGVDLELVWVVVKENLVDLEKNINKILKSR